MALADYWREGEHSDALYRVLLPQLADDLDAGGPTAQIVADHLDAPEDDAIHLRLLGGLHRIVLRGDAPQLERFYPGLGGMADPADAWPLVREVLADHVGELRSALTLAPQTNEPGRMAALAVGLFEAVRRHGLRQIRLLEPGASAGLNLLVDRARVLGPGWAWGPADSPLVLDTAAAGVRPEQLSIVDRRGCDLSPVDASTPTGARYLSSFVWPYDLERAARLDAALRIVRDHPVTVDRDSAAAWVRDRLAEPVADGVLTVIWHSITAQYWPAAERAALGDALASAGVPLAYITLEFRAEDAPLPLITVDGDPIGIGHFHGVPIELASGTPPAAPPA